MTQRQASRISPTGHPRFRWFAFIPVLPAVVWILVQSTSAANLAACAVLVLIGFGACAWSAGSQRDATRRAIARAQADQADADAAHNGMAARAQLDEVLLGAMPIWAKQVDGREAEALSKLQDRLVVRVDQLAAELGLLAVCPERTTELGPVRVHAAAQSA